MELTEDHIIEKCAKQSRSCLKKTRLPYEYEFTCISCGFDEIKRQHELTKIQRKKNIFINRMKYAEEKVFGLCVGENKICEGIDYDEKYQALCKLKNKIQHLSLSQ